LEHLGRQRVVSVLAEGGSELLGSLFDEHLVDEVYAFLSPRIIGGRGALTAVGGVGVGSVAQALQLQGISVRRLDQDILIHGLVAREE
jgi:diaminohydroxyphosphoribosylaminopyrimidine deaminase/5-amino-6-(5-phosphoribosylamino)uracil reductase